MSIIVRPYPSLFIAPSFLAAVIPFSESPIVFNQKSPVQIAESTEWFSPKPAPPLAPPSDFWYSESPYQFKRPYQAALQLYVGNFPIPSTGAPAPPSVFWISEKPIVFKSYRISYANLYYEKTFVPNVPNATTPITPAFSYLRTITKPSNFWSESTIFSFVGIGGAPSPPITLAWARSDPHFAHPISAALLPFSGTGVLIPHAPTGASVALKNEQGRLRLVANTLTRGK